MSTDSLRAGSGRAALVLAGLVLIVAPLLAHVVKAFSTGWMTFFIVYLLPLLVIGYALQVVIAAHAFLRPRAVLRAASGRGRALAAAWATSIGVLLAAFFMLDGGDTTWGSTFMYAFGLADDDAAGAVSGTLWWLTAAVWVLGWVWLVVEWIVAMVQRRRARAATA